MNTKDKDKNEEKSKPIIVRNTTDYQRLKLEKLMKNPNKPVIIPERPKERGVTHVPDFVRNVMGSSAGAGSGEFHVYRHLRRKEYARQKFMSEKADRERLNDEYKMKLEENKKKLEEKTAKKRAKRLKRKLKQKNKPKKPKLNQNTTDSSSENESSDEASEKEIGDSANENDNSVQNEGTEKTRDEKDNNEISVQSGKELEKGLTNAESEVEVKDRVQNDKVDECELENETNKLSESGKSEFAGDDS